MKRAFLVPEVLQTSAMDCGPASLKAMLEGLGIAISYGRLREACQTEVDGTSIDTLEDLAQELGVDAAQIMVPMDHLLLPEAEILPAIVVVRLPSGFTHFVVVWRQHGGLVQVMDPGRGRRWVARERFLQEVYLHETPINAAAYREWAASDDFLRPFRQRWRRIGAYDEDLLARVLGAEGWRSIAALDAAVRMTESLVRAGAIAAGEESRRLVRTLFDRAQTSDDVIPGHYWLARAHDDERVLLRGALLVHAAGRRGSAAPAPRSRELALAITEKPIRPLRRLLATLRQDGLLAPAVIVVALLAAVFATAGEALLLRGILDLGRALQLVPQRIAALAAVVWFGVALMLLELPLMAGALRMGRHLEMRFRVAFLSKLPRLSDRYFHSRPVSDMADRSHAVHSLRSLPYLGVAVVKAVLDLLVTAAAMILLDPRSAPLVVLAALTAVVVPLAGQPLLAERDLRAKSQLGALATFYLDAFLGLVPILTHGAQRAVRREHEGLLREWARTSRSLLGLSVGVEAVMGILSAAITVTLVMSYFTRADQSAAVLLLVYWALALPAIGLQLALAIRQYPSARSTTLRLLEPLGAPDEIATDARLDGAGGVAIAFEKARVVASGHPILEDVDLRIDAGAHVAVVGPSGAGKSSLLGVLLGWLRPSEGSVLVDGRPHDVEALRAVTAWVDPATTLWNRSLIDNLRYGNDGRGMGTVLEAADLHALLEGLPGGLQTPLGEGGALVSGGEGQRVRLGRALLHKDPRLVLLDEPFRGLDRERREALLSRARARWDRTTLLFVSHDVSHALDFDRVLVVDGGRIVEDGSPRALAEQEGSRFRAMLEAERALRETTWSAAMWRRITVREGCASEET